MSLAYCILAYKNPDQLGRLLRAISVPGNTVVLHYDQRAPRSEHEAVALHARRYGTRLLKPRAVLWARFSIVAAQLEAIRLALESGSDWSHFITLSGQDFPLQTQSAIIAGLEPATSYLSCFDPFTTSWWKDPVRRLDRYYFEWPALEALLKQRFIGRRIRTLLGWSHRLPCVPGLKRSLPDWFQYRGGSNHIILSREAAEYMVNAPLARKIAGWLRYSAIPEESAFQTILFNSPLRETMVNDDKRAIRWNRLGDPSPMTLTIADLPWLNEQRDSGRLFARKFDTAVDAEILGQLEKEIL